MRLVNFASRKKIFTQQGRRNSPPLFSFLFILICLFGLAAADFSAKYGHHNVTANRGKSLSNKDGQSDTSSDHFPPFHPALTESLPLNSDLPTAKRPRVNARASQTFSRFYDKGVELHRKVVEKLRDAQSADSGPSAVSDSWTVTDIFPGNPALRDPLFPSDEMTCEDSDDEDDGHIDLFSTFALDYYKISWGASTFKDIIAYLKSSSQIRYRNLFGPEIGVLVAKSIFGHDGGDRAPERWSDVTWPLWTKACQQNSVRPSAIRYIVQEALGNDDSKSLLDELTQGQAHTAGGTPVMFSWTPDQPGYYALLASPNGVGAAYLSLNYPSAMGQKYVSKVRAYKDFDIWSMVLELDPIS